MLSTGISSARTRRGPWIAVWVVTESAGAGMAPSWDSAIRPSSCSRAARVNAGSLVTRSYTAADRPPRRLRVRTIDSAAPNGTSCKSHQLELRNANHGSAGLGALDAILSGARTAANSFCTSRNGTRRPEPLTARSIAHLKTKNLYGERRPAIEARCSRGSSASRAAASGSFRPPADRRCYRDRGGFLSAQLEAEWVQDCLVNRLDVRGHTWFVANLTVDGGHQDRRGTQEPIRFGSGCQ